MADEAKLAVEHALEVGANYAEARLERNLGNTYTLKNGLPEPATVGRSYGVGVRVIVDGALGFASTNNLDRAQVRGAVEFAVKTAKASRRLLSSPVRLSQEKSWQDNWEVKMSIDPRSIEPSEKFGTLSRIEEALKERVEDVKLPSRILILDEDLTEKFYVNSEGARLQGFIPRLSLLFILTAEVPGKGVMQRIRHEGGAGGWELLEGWKPLDIASSEFEALGMMLKHGVPVPKGAVDLVLGPEVTGLICHESCGHPQEADRILGREAAQAGESYVNRDMLGYRVGSEKVTVLDDPTLPNSYGFYLYDEEGVKAKPRVLIRDGVINDLLHNRETAVEFQVSSNAASRASGYDREPIIRMANTYMKPGDYSLDELLEDVQYGVYMKSFMEWNIDDRRFNQRYVGLEAYIIEKGEVKTPVRNPILEVTTPKLYGNVDAVGRGLQFSAATCGKGDPMQGAPVWTGGPPIRVRGIKLGGSR